MAKKKATIDLNIKMASGKKTKANKPQQLDIDSPVIDIPNPDFDETKKASKNNLKEIEIPAVDHCISIAQQIESLKTELSLYEKVVVDQADEEKDTEKKKGNFVKTVNVKGSVYKLQIQFKDAYSKMDIAMKEPLKEIFKDKYPIMFAEITERTVVEDLEKIKELKQILGDRYDEFIVTDESVKPTKDFSYNHFLLEKSLKADQKETVQKVLDACAARPSVKYPK